MVDLSKCYVTPTVDESSEEIYQQIGIQVTTNSEKYLGLPMIVGRIKKRAFREILNKIKRKDTGLEPKMAVTS